MAVFRGLVLVALTVTLGACSTAPSSTYQIPSPIEAPPTLPSDPPDPPDPPVERPADRIIPKAIGEPGGFTNNITGEIWLTFTVTAIEVNPGCTTERADPPSLGNYVILSLTVEVLMPTPQGVFFSGFSPFDFRVVGPDGVTENDNVTVQTYSCLEDSELLVSGDLAVGSYAGKIVLDALNASGQVLYQPGTLSSTGGWVWEF